MIKLEETCRKWVIEALNLKLYETAIFWANKLVSINSANNNDYSLILNCLIVQETDIFLLAKSHHENGQYNTALAILSKKLFYTKYLDAFLLYCSCLENLKKTSILLDILKLPLPDQSLSFPVVSNSSTSIKTEAVIRHLHGTTLLKHNITIGAKKEFIKALELDVKCFDSFQKLIDSHLLSTSEELELFKKLDFHKHLNGNAELIDLVSSLYKIRMKKYNRIEEVCTIIEHLENKYSLHHNLDILLAKADTLFIQCKYNKCIKFTTKILEQDSFNFAVIPAHVTCLYELGESAKLFHFAHALVDAFPDSCEAWFAVGCYYLAIGDYRESNRFLSKSAMFSHVYAPTWMALGHSDALEGEHDHAILKYSTALKSNPGSHQALLNIAIQYSRLNNLEICQSYLNEAHVICPDDPLLEHEFGALLLKQNKCTEAIPRFLRALELSDAEGEEGKNTNWLPTFTNLAHAYRKSGQFALAVKYYDRALAVDPSNHEIYTCLGMIEHAKGDVGKAINHYHSALSISREDTLTLEMLEKALTEIPASNKSLPSDETELLGKHFSFPGEYIKKRVREYSNINEDAFIPDRLLDSLDNKRSINSLGNGVTPSPKQRKVLINEKTNKEEDVKEEEGRRNGGRYDLRNKSIPAAIESSEEEEDMDVDMEID